MINSLLDTDWYKLLMGQVVFNQFPKAQVEYTLLQRTPRDFPEHFATLLQGQINQLSKVELTNEEHDWLSQHKCFQQHFLEWFRGYRFNPNEIKITQTGTKLSITIKAHWYRAIYWEVPLMAMVSELFFQNATPVFEKRLETKTNNLVANNIKWADFGTRRRFSFAVQDAIVKYMASSPGFLGTSNPLLAKKYNVSPVGTMAHEGFMAMQALTGFANSNQAWMDAWIKEYDFDTVLPDTLSTKAFLKTFTPYYAKLFTMFRQDSGDPIQVANLCIDYWKNLGIDPKTRTIIFSDGLNDEKAVEIASTLSDKINCLFGIGTFLTNDVGAWALNIVIKLTKANFGKGWRGTVKLSDNPNKRTGHPSDIERALMEIQDERKNF